MNFFIVQHLNSQAWGCFFFGYFFMLNQLRLKFQMLNEMLIKYFPNS